MAGALRGGKSNNIQEIPSLIIQQLNTRFSIELSQADRVTLGYVQDRLAQKEAVNISLEVNSRDKASMAVNGVLEDIFQDVFQSNYNLYRQVTDNPRVKDALFT